MALAPRLLVGVAPWRDAEAVREAVTGWVRGSLDEPATERERRGIGTLLVRAADEWARGRGFARLTLETGAANHTARAFYAALGFQEEDVRLTRTLPRPRVAPHGSEGAAEVSLRPVRAPCPDRGDPRDGVEVGVDVQHGQSPRVRRGCDEQVDHRRPLVLTEVDERVLGAFHESPRIVRHGVPTEQGAQLTSQLITVGPARGGPHQFRLDDRAHAHETCADGVHPPRLNPLPAPQSDHHRGVCQEGHAAGR